MYSTRDGVERQAAEAIAARYKVARGAPILQDERLHNDFGFLANTGATDRVLNGTYDYPEDMDVYTKLLLQEAQVIFSKLLEEEVSDFVSTTDFQSYWKYAIKDI